MTYILTIGPWHVGPFSTHTAAQHFAETHGFDDFRMIELDDPAQPLLAVTIRSSL
jgi:hypothetical protein